jgi:hypothetical protein
MRSVRHLAVLLALVACSFGSSLRSQGQGAKLKDSAPLSSVGAGSSVVVNVEIILPANEGMIYFQKGAFVGFQELERSAPSCRLNTAGVPVVRKLIPGRKMIVTGARSGNGWPTLYGDTLLFEDDSAVGQLQCSSGHKGNMTIGELKICFGSLFSLVQAEPQVG